MKRAIGLQPRRPVLPEKSVVFPCRSPHTLRGTSKYPAVPARGFTLVELLIGVGVLALLMAIAVPSFSASRLNGQLRASANGLVASANLARSEAIKRGGNVRMCVSSNGTSCGTGNWRQGWIVLRGTEVLHRQPPIPAEFRITPAGGTTAFDFLPTGFDATPGTLVICRATPVGNQERVVTIDAAGRAWVRRSTSGACS